jgi:hypothetical protein
LGIDPISLRAGYKGYNFASDLIAIGGLNKKLCALKVAGVLAIAISKLPGQKVI